MVGMQGHGWLTEARQIVGCVCLGVVLSAMAGCESAGSRYGGLVQVQFYSPRGATIMLHPSRQSGMEIRSRDPVGDRLEHVDGELAVFDLDPGTYHFAYAGTAGAEDAKIYGELEVWAPRTKFARDFCRQAFVPIKLPSSEHQVAEHLNPSRDLSYTEGLEGREFAHLKQGDLITKVYFVADLERVKKERDVSYYQAINDLNRTLVVLDDRETYLDARYEDARRRALFRDPEMNVEDKIAHRRFDLWGTEESFVTLSRKRQELHRERETIELVRRELEDERQRRNALLRSIKIIHRAGTLVLATPDIVLPYRDLVDQASALGDVVAVVRYGGRHQYWADVMYSEPDTGARTASYGGADDALVDSSR